MSNHSFIAKKLTFAKWPGFKAVKKRVKITCPFCGDKKEVMPSQVKSYQTCGKFECKAKLMRKRARDTEKRIAKNFK